MKSILKPFSITLRDKAVMRPFLPNYEPEAGIKYRIPVCKPDLTRKETRYVQKALASSWISAKGTFVSAFEQSFASEVSGTKYAVAVNSGTSALHLSLIACGIGPGDEVILPAFTMIATVNAVRYTGAVPVLVDADPVTWNMDVSAVRKKITNRTKALLPVHIYGLPVDMDPLTALAEKHGLWVIEDAAEAHGAKYLGKPVGSLGDIAAFSLYANKIITTGEGGMVTTNNRKLADLVRLLRSHAFSPTRHFWHQHIGYSYEMTNLQAALGLAQAERFGRLVAKRRQHAEAYTGLLRNMPGITVPVDPDGYESVYWMYGICVDAKLFGLDRDALRRTLAGKGIETRTFFIPIHFQPPYVSAYRGQRFPVSERLCRDGLYLPSASSLSVREINEVATHIRNAKTSASM